MSSVSKPLDFEITDNEEYIDAAEKLYNIEQQIKKLTKEKSTRREFLKKRLPDNKTGLRVGKFVFKRSLRKGPIDYKNIPELKEIDIEFYRKPDVSSYSLEQVDN